MKNYFKRNEISNGKKEICLKRLLKILLLSFSVLLFGCSNSNECINYLSKYDDTFEQVDYKVSSDNKSRTYTVTSKKYPGYPIYVYYESAYNEYMDTYTNIKYMKEYTEKGTEIVNYIYPEVSCYVIGGGVSSSSHDESTSFEKLYTQEKNMYCAIIFREVTEAEFDEDVANCLDKIEEAAKDITENGGSITLEIKYYFKEKELPDNLYINYNSIQDYDARYTVLYRKGSTPKITEKEYKK